MFKNLVFTGQVRWSSRWSAVVTALRILWAAMNGWVIGGFSHPTTGAVDEGESPALDGESRPALPELRCGICNEVLGVNDLHREGEGYVALVMPCTKCRPTPRAQDAAKVPHKPNCGDRDCYECNPPRQ